MNRLRERNPKTVSKPFSANRAASALDLLMVFVHREDLAAFGPRLWIYCSHLALFGLLGLTMHWLQRNVPMTREETG